MGEGLFSELSHWIVLGLVILVVLFLFLSKTGLMPKVASTLLSAVDRWLPINPSEEAIASDPTRGPVINAQKQIIDDMSNYPDIGNCRLILRDISVLNDFEDYSIGISNDNSELSSVILRRTGESGAQQRTSQITSEQQLQVCVINPQEFYNCYISDSRPSNSEPCRSQTYRIAEQGVLINKDKITLSNNPNADSYSFSNYIFKPEPDKACFISIHSGTPIINDCDAEEFTIDQDCIEKVQQNIQTCEGIHNLRVILPEQN